LARLNPSAVHVRWWRFHAVFLINIFVNKITYPSVLNTIGLCTPVFLNRRPVARYRALA
jgi:hypothetical protein